MARNSAGRHRAEQRASQVGGARSDKLAVRIDRRVGRSRKGAARRDGLGEAHQRNAERARHQLLDQREVGHRERREALRDQADDRDALRRKAENPGRGDTAADCHQRSRGMRPQSLHADQYRERRESHRQRQQGSVGNVMRDIEKVDEEPLLGDVDSEELRHLIQHDHEADPRLETCEHRRGNEVGDKPETQQPRQEQHRTDQHGQRRRRGNELPGVAVRYRQPELRAGQDRQRGGGADAEHA
jgi:hypothetical protein